MEFGFCIKTPCPIRMRFYQSFFFSYHSKGKVTNADFSKVLEFYSYDHIRTIQWSQKYPILLFHRIVFSSSNKTDALLYVDFDFNVVKRIEILFFVQTTR